MVSSVWSIEGLMLWVLGHITIPRLMLYAWLPVLLVYGIKYWWDSRSVRGILISGIAYGESTFGVVVVMILVDGKWRPALPSEISYLPLWEGV